MTIKTFRARRWMAAGLAAAVVIGLPFLQISGESALRFDVPSLRLYFFGSVLWIGEAYFFLLALLLFFVGIMLFTVLYGRIWCGWACPQTVLSDFTRLIVKVSDSVAAHPALRALVSQAFILSFSVFVSANLIWYFVSPSQLFREVAADTLGPWTSGSWIFLSVMIYLDLAFVRHRFCGAVCPYARLQSAFFDHATLTIVFDESRSAECAQCEACVRECPAGIDIREGLQVECINCAQCIDACRGVTAGKNRKPLIGYSPGKGGADQKRPRVLGLSVVFAVIAVLFAYQIFVRVPVDFLVLSSAAETYHQTGFKGTLMNAYDLFVENRSLDPGEYRLTVSGIKDAELAILRNPFVVPRNSSLQTRIYIFVKRKNVSERITRLRFVLESTKTPEIKIVREAPFLYPERTDKGVEI